MAARIKAERCKRWRQRVNETNGREAALYVRAADSTPTRYLRTPSTNTPSSPVCAEGCGRPDSDASTATSSDSDASDGGDSQDDDGWPDVPDNSILADTQAMLDLMVRTWEPILGRYLPRGSRDDEPLPTWDDF